MANFQENESFVLLSDRDKLTETYIRNFLEQFERENGSFNNLPADLSLQTWLSRAEAELTSNSLLLGHRLSPMVKDFIRTQFEKHLEAKYGHILLEPENDFILARKYRTCFNIFMNDTESVHFATFNSDLIKKISMQHYFTLMYYSMATMKRVEGDNCLCLLVVGASSTGKTLLFESPVQQVSHNFANEAGVGRFQCNGKSILLLHDVQLKVLISSRDMEKLKGLARTEQVSVKVHSRCEALSPIFILGTSNQLLFPHRFDYFAKQTRCARCSFPSDLKPSASICESDINAIRHRFLELMVRQKPPLPANQLPRAGNFKREHLIVGLFQDVINILFMYRVEDFGSEFLYLYAIFSLCKNFHMNLPADQEELYPKILDLFIHYNFSDQQVNQCFEYLLALF